MNNIKKVLAVSAVAVTVTAGAIAVLADQENNFDSPCVHSYQVTAFANNTATAYCSHCGDVQQFNFAESVGAVENEADYAKALDVYADGIINGRDLAHFKLMQN